MTEPETTSVKQASEAPADRVEDYAGGYIQERRGRIPAWLLAVYAILFLWALYYLVNYWGGLGPGRMH